MKTYLYKATTAVILTAAFAINGLACTRHRAYRSSYVTRTRTVVYTPVSQRYSQRVYYAPASTRYYAPNRYYAPTRYYAPSSYYAPASSRCYTTTSSRVYYAPNSYYAPVSNSYVPNNRYYYDENGYIVRRGHSTRDKILTVAVPAAIAAGIGGIAGGGKGAGIGALVGGGGGALYYYLKHRNHRY